MGNNGIVWVAGAIVDAPDDMPRASNELIRTIAYGEALRAVSTYIGQRMLEPPTGPTVDLLDDAYERMILQRQAFSPEDFGVYVLSLILELVEHEEDVQLVRIGAAQYLLDVMPYLAPDLQSLSADARRILAEANVVGAEIPRSRHLLCLSDALPPSPLRLLSADVKADDRRAIAPPAGLPESAASAPLAPQPTAPVPELRAGAGTAAKAETAAPVMSPGVSPRSSLSPRMQDRMAGERERLRSRVNTLRFVFALFLAAGAMSLLVLIKLA